MTGQAFTNLLKDKEKNEKKAKARAELRAARAAKKEEQRISEELKLIEKEKIRQAMVENFGQYGVSVAIQDNDSQKKKSKKSKKVSKPGTPAFVNTTDIAIKSINPIEQQQYTVGTLEGFSSTD